MGFKANFDPSGEVIRVPLRLAERLTIGGTTPAQTRLAIVLVSLAGGSGSWTINKPVLERMTGTKMNNAFKILMPLEEATLVAPAAGDKPARHVRLFEKLDYVPGRIKQTAGMVSVQLTLQAQGLLHSQGVVVHIPCDELRSYSSMGAIVLRLRLGARLSRLKTIKNDSWKLSADAMGWEFGVHAEKWTVQRNSKKTGEEKGYLSLSRAAHLFFDPAAEEINAVSEAMQIEIKPLALTGGTTRSRWKAIVIKTYPLADPGAKSAPAATPASKPKLSQLSSRNARRAKLPAYARKAKIAAKEDVGS